GDVLRKTPCLPKRVLAGWRVGLFGARVRDARAVAQRPHVLVPAHAQEFVHLDTAALVERQAERVQERIRPDARGPDERVRRDRRPVAEHHLALAHRRERRPDVDLEASALELAGRVFAEARWDLGQDLRRGVHEYPALWNAAEPWVEAERVVDEVGQLGQ